MKIFISSFQKEFARERKILNDYLSGDLVSDPVNDPVALGLESRLESRLGSRLESKAGSKVGSKVESKVESVLAMKILLLIGNEETSNKASIARLLGHKRVSGAIHEQIKRILEMGLIEFTIPDKPASRLQEYRLTKKGREMLEQLEKEGDGA